MQNDSTSEMAVNLNGEQYCYIETTGRVTGNWHEVEMWYAAGENGRVYALSGGRDRSDWVKNLIANPSIRVRIGDTTYPGQAWVAENTPDEPAARRMLATKYQNWSEGRPLSNWARTSLPVAIDLDIQRGVRA